MEAVRVDGNTIIGVVGHNKKFYLEYMDLHISLKKDLRVDVYQML